MRSPAALLSKAGLLASVIAVAAVALATPTLRIGPSPVSTTLYPEQELNVDFDHAGHLDGRGLECLDCHRIAETSRSPTDNLLPQEAQCVACHREDTRPSGRGGDRLEARCRSCHTGEGPRVDRSLIPTSRLRFSHADHSGSVGCERCHTRVSVRRMATVDDLPSMELCLSCHDGREAERRCETCHLTEPDGRLQVRFGEQRLVPATWMYGAEHGPTWTDGHAEVAVERRAFCQACHQDHECLACHDGDIRPRDVHPGDWLSTHSVEARAGELRCQGCHRGQSFCRTCHLRAGVSRRSPIIRLESTASVVHQGADWASSTEPRHGREARRNLATCVSCHAGQDCVTCHVTINPHGPGFLRRCRSLVRAGSRACVACHGSVEGLCD